MPWNFSLKILIQKVDPLLPLIWLQIIIVIYTNHNCSVQIVHWDFLIQPVQWTQSRILKPETFGCAKWRRCHSAKILISSMKMPSKSLVISPEVPRNTHGRSQRAVTEQWLAVPSVGWLSKVADHRDDGKEDTHGGATIQDTLCKYCLGSCINKETKQYKIMWLALFQDVWICHVIKTSEIKFQTSP